MQVRVKKIRVFEFDLSEKEMVQHVQLLKNAQPINVEQTRFRDEQLEMILSVEKVKVRPLDEQGLPDLTKNPV